jgi:photosystem II stability/assembly factor-like uncharacterized protein
MKAYLILTVIIIILFQQVAVEAEWGTPVSIPFPQGQAALALFAVDTSVVWCNAIKTTGGISNWFARTIDGGASWKANIIPGAGNLDNGSITALDSLTAWVTMRDLQRTTSGGIFKTTNGGVTWFRQSTVFNETGENPMFIYFWNADTGLVVGDNVKSWEIYTTTNGGTSWAPIPQSNIPPISGDLLTEGFEYEVVGNSFWFCTSSRVFRSRDRGQTWSASAIGPGYGRVHSVAFQDQNIGLATSFTANGNPTIVKTTDGGDTWFSITPPTRPTPHILEHIPGTTGVYIVTGHIWPGTLTGSAYTTDAGLHWTNIDNLDHGQSVFVAPNVGWIGGYPNSFSNMSKWLGSVLVTSIPLAGLQLWLKSDAGITLNGSTISNWADQSGNGNDAIQSAIDRQPLLVNNELNNKPVLRFDGWNDKLGFTGSTPMSQISTFIVFRNNSGATGLYPDLPLTFGSGSNMDLGKQYFLVMKDLTGNIPNRIGVALGSESYILATATNIEAHGEWRNISIVTNQTIWNTTLRYNGYDASISKVGSDAAILAPLGDAAGSGGGIGGADGVPFGTIEAKCDVAEVIVYKRAVTDSERLAVENYFKEKYNISNTTGVKNSLNESIPERFALSQNYPNPFNPSTTISFSLTSSEYVILKVFDVMGREITTLVNEEKPVGNYNVKLDGIGLSSGIYFYTLKAGKYAQTKKLILLK